MACKHTGHTVASVLVGFLSLLFCCRPVESGLISGWDIIVNYSNSNILSKYTFAFSVETPLESTDYILIEMPYQIHSSISASNVPLQVSGLIGKVNYTNLCTSSCSSTTTKVHPLDYIVDSEMATAIVTVSASTQTLYFVSLSAMTSLESGTEYVIILSSTMTLSTTLENIQYFVKLSSVSSATSTSTSSIVSYDSNNLFSALKITSSVTSTSLQGVDYEVNSSTQTDFLSVYEVFVDFMHTQISNTQGSLYEIDFGQYLASKFSFVTVNTGTLPHLCSSVTRDTNAFVINALNPSLYTCTVSSKRVSIEIPQILVSQRLRFSVYIVNPNEIPSSSEYLIVTKLKLNSRHAYQQGVTTSFLSVRGIILNTSSMKLGWGVDTSVQVAPSTQLPLIANSGSGVITYNSIQFGFNTLQSSPTSMLITVRFCIATTTPTLGNVLTGSIIHNFTEETAYGLRIECSELLIAGFPYIQCINIGAIIAGKDYYIGFKITIANGDTPSTTLFSQISASMINPTTQTTSTLMTVQSITDSSTITTLDNIDYFMSGSGHTAISSQTISKNSPSNVYSPHGDADNGILGLVPEDTVDTAQKLVLTISLSNSAFTTLSASTANVGFYMLTNKNAIQFSSASDLTIDTYGSSSSITSTTAIQFSFDEYDSDSLGQYTRFRYKTTTASNLAALFTANNIFAIRNTFVRQHSSLYADDNNIDFYFFFFDNMALPAPTLSFTFMYNAYTVNSPKPFNLRYSIANWYGGANVYNDGTYVPSLLRIAGYFNEQELRSGTKRLALFFTGLELFAEDNSFGVSCASSIGTTPTLCRGFSNTATVYQNFHSMSRVEIEFPTDLPSGSVDSFEFIIPVKTIVKITSITLFVAPMEYHKIIPTTLLEQQAIKDYFFSPTSVFRLTGSNNLQNTNYFISFSEYEANNIKLFSGYRKSGITLINNYGIDLSSNLVGELISSVAINAHHTEDGTIVGTNTQDSSTQYNGAGFTFAAEFDFRSSQQNFVWAAGIPSNIRRCITFQYYQVSNWRYGFFCAIETASAKTVSQVLVSNFQLPSEYGLILPSSTSFAFSTSQGLLATLKYASQSIGKANSITTTATAATPILFKGAMNLRIVWTFTTTNPIPDNGIVNFEFENHIGLSLIGTTCSFVIDTAHTCTVTVPSYQDNVIRFTVAQTTAGVTIPSGIVQIFHYGNDAHLIPTSVNRFLVKTYNSNLNLIDQTDPVLMYPGLLDHRLLSAKTKFILLQSYMQFSQPYTNAESSLEIVFNTANARELQVGEVIFLNLKAFGSVNYASSIYSQISCFLYRNSTIMSHSISEIQIISTSTNLQVILTVKKDIFYSKSSPFTLKCYNVRMVSTSSISPLPSIELRKSDKVTSILSPIEIPCESLKTTAAAMGTPVLGAKRFPTHGSITSLSFTFTTTTTVGTNYFLVRFPYPYLPSLSQDASLRCLINSVATNCVIKSSRLLQIQAVPENVSSFTLQIQGVQTPSFTVVVGSEPFFYLAHMHQVDDASSKLSTLISYAFVNDVAPTALVQNILEISNVTLSNTHVQSTNNLAFTFDLPSALSTVSASYTLVLSFPAEWRYLLELLTPSVTLKRNSTNTYITLNTIQITSVVEVTFTWAASTTPSEPLILKIFNIPNPEVLIPVQRRQWNLHISDSSSASVLYARSIPMQNSVPYFSYNYLADKLVLIWKYASSTETSYKLNKGPFKTLVTLAIKDDKRFTHPLRIQLKSDSLFSLTPARPLARPGDTELSFYVHSLTDTPTSSFIVFFTKQNDSFKMYTNMPVCYFDVARTIQPIQFADTSIQTISVPKNGKSDPFVLEYTPLGFNITADAVVTVQILNSGSFGLSILNEESVKILSGSNTSPRISFQFAASSTSIVGAQLYLKFSVSVVDSNLVDWSSMFQFSDTQIPLEVTLLKYSGASYQLISSGLDEISTNSIIFRPICPQQGVIYYRIQLNNIYNLTDTSDFSLTTEQQIELKTLIQSGATGFIDYSVTDLTQTQYGFAISDGTSAYTEITIQNLLSSKPYSISSFCLNPFSQSSSNILSSNFTTLSNGGQLQKIYLSFASPLSIPEQIMATCYLSIFFGVTPTNVYSINRVTCDDYTTQYDFDNSESKTPYVTSTQRNGYTFYFVPDLTVKTDYITEQVQSVFSYETFAFSIKKFFSKYASYQFLEWGLELPSSVAQTFPNIVIVSELEAVSSSTQNFPVFDEEYYINISQTTSDVSVDFVRLSKEGFIFVGLENTLQNHRYEQNYLAYSSNQLLRGKNYLGKNMTYGVQFSLATSSSSTKVGFQDLPYTNNYDRYEVYMAVSEEDPSPFAMKSTVRKTTLINYSAAVTYSELIKLSVLLIIFLGFTVVF